MATTVNEEEKKLQQQAAANANTTATNTAVGGNTATSGNTYAGMSAAQTSAGTAAAPSYANTYGDQVNELYTRITNRQPFSYDVNGDALYQQYKDKYIQQGKQAMKDTMGQAAALTGGYGSSYGQQVGQQTYDAYLQNLNDVIPDLYQTAYSRYQGEGEDLQNQLAAAEGMQNTEYNQYLDQLSQYNTEQQMAYQQQQDALAQANYEAEQAYQKEQDAYNKQQQSYSQLASVISSTGYTPSADELSAAGMSSAQANALRQAWIVGNPVAAYRAGALDANGYYQITGAYPNGYAAPQAAATYYSGPSTPSGNKTLSDEDIKKAATYGYGAVEIINAAKQNGYTVDSKNVQKIVANVVRNQRARRSK